jgi:hypothetical protein
MRNAECGFRSKWSFNSAFRNPNSEFGKGGEKDDTMEMFKLRFHVWGRYRP